MWVVVGGSESSMSMMMMPMLTKPFPVWRRVSPMWCGVRSASVPVHRMLKITNIKTLASQNEFERQIFARFNHQANLTRLTHYDFISIAPEAETFSTTFVNNHKNVLCSSSKNPNGKCVNTVYLYVYLYLYVYVFFFWLVGWLVSFRFVSFRFRFRFPDALNVLFVCYFSKFH